MAETRHKLSTKQYTHYTAARQRVIQAKNDFDAAQVNFATVSELIMDHFDIPVETPARIDDQTKELVVGSPEPANQEAKPEKRRAPKVPAIPPQA